MVTTSKTLRGSCGCCSSCPCAFDLSEITTASRPMMVASAATAAARAKMKSQLQMVVGLRDAVLLFDDDAIADLCVFSRAVLDNNKRRN